jgi:hypothetical protein
MMRSVFSLDSLRRASKKSVEKMCNVDQLLMQKVINHDLVGLYCLKKMSCRSGIQVQCRDLIRTEQTAADVEADNGWGS